MIDEKTMEKVRKLLVLSEGTSEHESAAAMMRARAILAQHGMDVADVPAAERKSQMVERTFDATSDKWERNLAGVLSDHFGCAVFFTSYEHSATFTYIGRPEDAATCVYAHSNLRQQMRRLANAAWNETGRYISTVSRPKWTNDYKLGAVQRINILLKEGKRTEESGITAIVVQRNALAKEFMREKYNTRTARSRPTFTSSSAKTMGYEDGAKLRIQDAQTGKEYAALNG